ncbi:SbcC/MukB-like Walker B domain-containing protein [Actinocorallia populi]|uniref:SbcC/MukB-like Walker B domain-containing protein n=1 Tax=Actinocorallia populi TaxID=2079200 RepID=UPI000D08960A|nr:SbcC/MukB-like Walker B domain-containing protein [Actinocorallia populi]
MTEPRWMPTRAGILNVWRYYDEVFEFHKGRLLLRGPNGSGKSKMLELLLPFVLDGSLKASRLSTFGGTERTMHWNLMGDGATGTTRAGYVWVEFGHTDGRWFTCGVRLQATAHTTTVTPTYFITGLRVGDGLSLTTETQQPLTRAQLEAAIGVHGAVYSAADDYRTRVRQTLYQELSEARYDSLLAALRQLRTPKLSERLDPGLLSELLSSALPPLGEGEIHEIAEGFERLDRQRTDLRDLDEHVEEAARLAARQKTYAQRVLRAASQTVLGAVATTETAENELKAGREALRAAEEELEKVTAAHVETDNLVKRLDAKVEGLKESEAYRAGHDLSRLRAEAVEVARLADEQHRRAEEAAREAAEKEKAAEQARQELSEAENLLTQAEDDAARIAQHSGLETVYEELRRTPGVAQARTLLRAAISTRATRIREAGAQVRAHAHTVRLRTEAEHDRDEALERLASAKEIVALARTARDELGNDLAAAYAVWAEKCTLLELDGPALTAAAEDAAAVEALVGAARDSALDRLATGRIDTFLAAAKTGPVSFSLADERKSCDVELAVRPDRGPFEAAVRELDRAEHTLADREDAVSARQERVKAREKEVAAAFRKLGYVGAKLGLPTSQFELDLLDAARNKADEALNVWLDARERARAAAGHRDTAQQTAEAYRALAERAAAEAEETAARAEALAERHAAVDTALNASHREILQSIQESLEERRAGRARLKELAERRTALRVSLGVLSNEAAALEARRAETARARDRAVARFHRLTRGHLLTDARLDVSPPGTDPVAVAAAARSVVERLPGTPHEPRSVREAETALQEAYHHARDALQTRADLELTPDDDVRILTASVGGIRLGVAAFEQALRAERDERSADINESEHELFDRTLAGDVRRHLADRIRQAAELVAGMNERLRRVRTASRVAVELVWQVDPRRAADTLEARGLLLRDPGELDEKGRAVLHRFFRGLLDEARADDTAASWEEQLLKVLDYTAWHQFVVRLDRGDGRGWHELTRKLHGALSGGEKAIALHLPLFAAVAAHYRSDPGCPRFILLDEVFVGVDRANRGQVFQLLVDLGLDLVLTSDHEWCEYRELDGIAVHVLQTGDGDDAVTTTRFVWDGERTG